MLRSYLYEAANVSRSGRSAAAQNVTKGIGARTVLERSRLKEVCAAQRLGSARPNAHQ
jgi:hypothetical protein